jgi:SAM-dependent methyltransferase
MSISRIQLENWLKTIEVSSDNVIDFGGSQLPIKNRVRSWNVKDYKIQDLHEPHQCKQSPDICFDINMVCPIIDKFVSYFDIAFAIELSEYLWNPVQAFLNFNLMLKKGGILYFSSHFNYPIHNPVGCDYLRYTFEGIKKITENTGFEIIDCENRICDADSGYVDLMSFYHKQKMRPAKEYDQHNVTGLLIKAIKL